MEVSTSLCGENSEILFLEHVSFLSILDIGDKIMGQNLLRLANYFEEPLRPCLSKRIICSELQLGQIETDKAAGKRRAWLSAL